MKKRVFALVFLSCAMIGPAMAGPAPSLGDEAALFDRLTGAWNTDYTFYDKDGKATPDRGDFTTQWVMEGRVQQSIYTIDRAAEHKEKYIGASLNYLDAKSKIWRQVFVDPEADAVIVMKGGPVGKDQIVLQSDEKDGKVNRWTFADIKAGSFTYRDETSRDGGKSWRLNEEDRMTRRQTAQARQ